VVASFVDVPGHERFVHHMLAGAHGIDAVALVVAADESVMPQTHEHFHICRLLGIARGLVVLTKCDVADADSQALAELEARELVAGSFLEGGPVLRVSSRTGAGLPELREALLTLAREAPPRPTTGLLRLPIDRVFSLKGFGTVVTGTVVGGELRTGEDVEVLPSGRRLRVRGLQVHGAPVDRTVAGTRTAVNLGGVLASELERGEVLTRPGTLRPTSMIDASVSLLAGARPLRDGARVRVHLASAMALARVRLLGVPLLEPGASEVAQLRLEAPAVAGRGDRLVLRSYSPADTIAGAVVVDPLPPRRRTADRAAVVVLRDADTAAAAAEVMVSGAGARGIDAELLAARLTIPLSRLAGELEKSRAVAMLGSEPAVVVSRNELVRLAESAAATLGAFHRQHPLKAWMPREELRARVFGRAPLAVFERVIDDLAAAGEVRLAPDGVSLWRHEVRLSADEEEARTLLVEAALKAGFAGVETAPLAARASKDAKLLDRVGRLLAAERLLERVGKSLLVHRDHLEGLGREVRRRWPSGSKLEVGALKDLTGLSRKHVIPLLEYLDRVRVTRRVGNDRIVL
jgi:selenocysteine-specific elongation factor